MKTLIVYVLMTCTIVASAQPNPDTLWTWQHIGVSAHSIQHTADRGYISAGRPSIVGQPLLVKFDEFGDTLWTGCHQIIDGEAYSVKQTSDGGYILAGVVQNPDLDILVIKTNSVGDTLWKRIYGGSGGDEAYDVIETSDHCYVIAGHISTYDSYWGWNRDVYIVKINQLGDTLWTHTYGQVENWDGARSIQETTDGGFIIAGHYNLAGRVWLLKADSNGDTIWTRVYQGGGHGEMANSVQQTSDGGYIIAGYKDIPGNYSNRDFYLIKTNTLGNITWARTYGDTTQDWANSVNQTMDGGYIVAGYTESIGTGIGDFCLMKVAANGDSLWTKTYEENSGPSYEPQAYCVQETADGGYIAAGTVYPWAGTPIIYVVKTGPGIRITSPNDDEEWRILQTDTIRWIGTGFRGGVQVELNRHYPDGEWETLIDSTENDGEVEIIVPSPPSEYCRIRISGLESDAIDISDSNFSIVSSQGYLALILSNQPEIAVESWMAGTVECPNTTSQTYYLKNFGNESIIVYPPEFSIGVHFTIESQCDTIILSPSEVSVCSLTIVFDPLEDGIHHDTLLIMSDAVNSQSGYVRIPLSGQQISTPLAPVVTIAMEGNNARLTWSPITESILGCDVSVTGYIIFNSLTPDTGFHYQTFTLDTTFVNVYVGQFNPAMFYEVVAYNGQLSRLNALPVIPGNDPVTREEVLGLLNNPR